MIDKGWIKLHRELMDKVIWKKSTVEQKVILITLLMMANHKDNEWEWQGRKFKIKAGQFITSSKSIEECSGPGITRQNVRTALDKFEKYEFLTKQSTNTGMLISITNWEVYQSYNDELTNQLTSAQPMGNQRVTSDQPTGNQRLTTNKNDKKDKNVKNEKNEKIESGHKALIDGYTDNIALKESINDFILMRKSLKKPLTDKALKMIFTKLDGLTPDVDRKIDILNQSTLNCWQSVYPIKIELQTVKPSYAKGKEVKTDFKEREYDYKELEEQLLRRDWG